MSIPIPIPIPILVSMNLITMISPKSKTLEGGKSISVASIKLVAVGKINKLTNRKNQCDDKMFKTYAELKLN